MKQLKEAIGHLVGVNHGYRPTVWRIVLMAGLAVVVFAIVPVIALLVYAAIRSRTGVPPSFDAAALRSLKFRGTLVVCVVGWIVFRDWYKNRAGVRRAISLARDIEHDRASASANA
jgi:hypothetical protein